MDLGVHGLIGLVDFLFLADNHLFQEDVATGLFVEQSQP